jgi:glycosyltransferase involved in cell wall biosynthesis
MVAKAISLIQKHQTDVVLISCPPFHQAIPGILLKKLFGIKLVVDYRDGWSLNPYYQKLDWLHRCILTADKVMEKCLLLNTDLLTVTHQTMRDKYLSKFSFLKHRIKIVYNGFDPENIGSGGDDLFPEFTILHLGDFYVKQKTRDPGLFLQALQRFISQRKIAPGKLHVLFVGERYEEVEKTISGLGLSAYVSCVDRVPHDVAMKYLNKSHMLLLIESGDVMTTKVFEYLATGKPILALIKGGEIKDLIEKFSKRSFVITTSDLHRLMMVIEDGYKNYLRNRYEPDESFRASYSRKSQTKQLAICLDRLVQDRSIQNQLERI